MPNGRARSGQAMVETVIAVLVIAFVFLMLFRLSQLLTGKILLEHAAMRVARARAVGMNEFMCIKAGRVSVIPVSGERLWPSKDDVLRGNASETALARMYMRAPDFSYADGLLRYENWDRFSIDIGGDFTRTSMRTDWFELNGEAEVDRFPDYMNNLGL